MTTVQNRPRGGRPDSSGGQLAAVTIVGWVAFALLADLEANGLHLLVLGGLRVGTVRHPAGLRDLVGRDVVATGPGRAGYSPP